MVSKEESVSQSIIDLKKRESNDLHLLIIIIISGCGILVSVIISNIFQYEGIPLTWKIAITTFIILLPISLFLQPLMAYSNLRTKRLVSYNKSFNNFWRKVAMLPEEMEKKPFDKLYTEILEVMSRSNPDLATIYRTCFNKLNDEIEELLLKPPLLQREKMNLERENIDLDRIIVQKKMNFLNLNLSHLLEKVVNDELRAENKDFRSYFLPISFFMIIYFGGFLVTIPLINSIFEGGENTTVIPLINKDNIPIQAIQWGFLGGVVYTSINLINRFLRSDLIPQVYLYSSYRLIFSVVAAIIVYFVYVIANPTSFQLDNIYKTSTILLTCFAIGIAPINFLIRFGQSIALKLMEWKSSNNAGNQNVTVLEGINLVISERLGEEGIENIQQLAFCDPEDLSNKTHFDNITICDWKDQALLYLYTHNIMVCEKDSKLFLPLNEILISKMGIRTYSQLRDIYNLNLKLDSSSESEITENVSKGINALGKLKEILLSAQSKQKNFIEDLGSNDSLNIEINENISHGIIEIDKLKEMFLLQQSKQKNFIEDLGSKLCNNEIKLYAMMDVLTSYTDLYYEKMIQIRLMADPNKINLKRNV